MFQQLQPFEFPTGEAVTLTGTHTVNMTGWTLTAVMTDAAGNIAVYVNGSGATLPVPAKTVGSGLTVGVGDNGTGTKLTIDYASTGESKGLRSGRYHVSVRREDAGSEGLKAALQLSLIQQDAASPL
jgi:hypothetical protein